MVKLKEIIAFLNEFAPACFAEDYDNVGLLLGKKEKDINNIMITLDADEAVAKEAKSNHCELLISHHPLIFKPLKKIVDDDSVSRTVMELIRNDVALFSTHTNFDGVKSGLCDLFFDKIADTKERTSLEGDAENGCGRVAKLQREHKLSDILAIVKKEFNLEAVRYVGDKNAPINKIALCNGGGADFIYAAKQAGADLYISGDIKYHHARFAYENGISLIEVPHYNAEIIFCEYLKKLLNEKFGKNLNIFISDKNTDIWNNF